MKDGTLRAVGSGGGRKRLSGAAPRPHDSGFSCMVLFGNFELILFSETVE